MSVPIPAPSGPVASPTRLGRYDLLVKLATGGMAEIFLARLRGIGGFERFLVVKRMLPSFVDEPQFVQMFMAEARLAAQIEHPNVCQVLDVGEDGGQYFLVMEYLDGVPLNVLIPRLVRKADGRDVRLTATILVRACQGLHHAHELCHPDGRPTHLVHRDVSPHNIFVTRDGQVKVLDFGVAKVEGITSATRSGAVKGKFGYMAPEQIRAEPVDRRADVFALGVIAWEALTGQRLFRRDSIAATVQAAMHAEIPMVDVVRPDVPSPVAQIVARALDRTVDQRIPSARALAAEFEAAVTQLGGLGTAGELAAAVEEWCTSELEAAREKRARASTIAAAPAPAAISAGAAVQPVTLSLFPVAPPSTATAVTAAKRPRPGLIRGARADADAEQAGTATATIVEAEGPATGVISPERRAHRGKVAGVLSVSALAVGVLAAVVVSRRDGADAPAVQALAIPAGATATPPPPLVAAAPSTAPAPEPAPRVVPTKPTRTEPARRRSAPAIAHGVRGKVSIDARPDFARIYHAGKLLGETPLLGIDVAAGTQRFVAERVDGTRQGFTIDVTSGRTATRIIDWSR